MAELLGCPVCESCRRGDYSLVGVASQPGDGVKNYEVLRCRIHGVEFCNVLPPQVSEAGLKASLDNMYGTDGRVESKRYADFLDRVMNVRPSPGVLHDVGCGNGHLLHEAARRGWAVQGNDVVSTAVEALQGQSITCWSGALPDLDLQSGSCDVVTSYCVIPHVIHPRQELEATRRLLKPGGWLVAQLPDDGLYRKFVRLLYRLSGGRWRWLLANIYGAGGHHFAYDRRSIRVLLSKLGFDEVRVEPFYPNPAWSLCRFRSAGWHVRVTAATTVYILFRISRLLNLPNHMFVYARKPLDCSPPSHE